MDKSYQRKIELGRAACVAFLAEDGNGDAQPSEDEYRLEDMPHDLTFLNIRLRDPHPSSILSYPASWVCVCVSSGTKRRCKHSSGVVNTAFVGVGIALGIYEAREDGGKNISQSEDGRGSERRRPCWSDML
jgi:hypothetical protein